MQIENSLMIGKENLDREKDYNSNAEDIMFVIKL
jgi:hypothetical protein